MSRPARIVSVVGTRPNFMKIAPVVAELERRDFEHLLIHTGQHYDALMSDVFFHQLDVGAPDYVLDTGSGTHAVQTARVLERLEPVLVDVAPDLLLVPGDVNSTVAAALVAAKLGIPIGHVEAGLRSFDRSMPEEVNRTIADQLSDLLFTHSPEARTNLLREGRPDASIHEVGNTMIDTLVALHELVRAQEMPAKLGLDHHNYVLVTLHRPALTDGPLLARALDALAIVARNLPVIFPVHPRTRLRMQALGLQADGVTLLEPQGYLEFMSLVESATAVLTDSGGIQEETTFLGVPCYTLRDNTERPITVSQGTNTLLGLTPERIADLPQLIRDFEPRSTRSPAGWDGHAAERIVDVIDRVVTRTHSRGYLAASKG